MKRILTTTLLGLHVFANKAHAVALANPLGQNKVDPNQIIGNIIKSGLSFLGIVALVMFLYGGLQMFFSRGDDKKIKQGRDTIIWAAIGLVVIFSSYALVSYVLAFITTL
ncbi:hypothetical protein IT409_02345 [Candidatus Falkowbacteria bacterium]|nr:hypothetical protein [Candidatus Falkowbacteria bacterium]